jgi:hypothetical protein
MNKIKELVSGICLNSYVPYVGRGESCIAAQLHHCTTAEILDCYRVTDENGSFIHTYAASSRQAISHAIYLGLAEPLSFIRTELNISGSNQV